MIIIKNLNKYFEGKRIFEDFSLEIKKGEMVALVGNSGCGKTTLLNMIGLLEPIDSGELILCGHVNVKPGSKKAERLLRESISYLFQNYALIENETVQYNLMLALKYVAISKSEKEERLRQALKEVGLTGIERQKVFRLSGGEQQRVAIARCMLKPCELILADEPTGSVDSDNREIILDLVQKMHEQGKTIVIVTHDSYVAERCGRQIHLIKA